MKDIRTRIMPAKEAPKRRWKWRQLLPDPFSLSVTTWLVLEVVLSCFYYTPYSMFRSYPSSVTLSKLEAYFVLGISPFSDKKAIKKAYRSLSLHYHPERHHVGGLESEKNFQLVSSAYEVLSSDWDHQKWYGITTCHYSNTWSCKVCGCPECRWGVWVVLTVAIVALTMYTFFLITSQSRRRQHFESFCHGTRKILTVAGENLHHCPSLLRKAYAMAAAKSRDTLSMILDKPKLSAEKENDWEHVEMDGNSTEALSSNNKKVK